MNHKDEFCHIRWWIRGYKKCPNCGETIIKEDKK